jgi:polyisoprenoid-binding protein YceI
LADVSGTPLRGFPETKMADKFPTGRMELRGFPETKMADKFPTGRMDLRGFPETTNIHIKRNKLMQKTQKPLIYQTINQLIIA